MTTTTQDSAAAGSAAERLALRKQLNAQSSEVQIFAVIDEIAETFPGPSTTADAEMDDVIKRTKKKGATL